MEEWGYEEEREDEGEEEWFEEEALGGEEDAGGEDDDSWSRGDWSQDSQGNWQWSVDFSAGKAADAEMLQPAAGMAAVVAAAVQAAVGCVYYTYALHLEYTHLSMVE